MGNWASNSHACQHISLLIFKEDPELSLSLERGEPARNAERVVDFQAVLFMMSRVQAIPVFSSRMFLSGFHLTERL